MVFSQRIYNSLIWIGYFALSVIWYFAYLAVANFIKGSITYGTMAEGVGSPLFYLSILFTVMFSMAIFYFRRCICFLIHPTANETAMAMMKAGSDKAAIRKAIKELAVKERMAYSKRSQKKGRYKGLIGWIEG